MKRYKLSGMWPTLLADKLASSFHHFWLLGPLLPFLSALFLPPPCHRSVMKHGCQYVARDEQGPTQTYRRMLCGLRKNVCACMQMRIRARAHVGLCHFPQNENTWEHYRCLPSLSFSLRAAAILPVPPLLPPPLPSSLKVQRLSNQAGNESGRQRQSSKTQCSSNPPPRLLQLWRGDERSWISLVATSDINMKLEMFF